jgi:hypothetical protein
MSTPPVDPSVARGGDARPSPGTGREAPGRAPATPGAHPDSTDPAGRHPPSRSADPGQGSRGGWRGDDPSGQPTPKARDDDELAAALRDRLRGFADLDVSGVRIAVADGLATLDGHVADEAARAAVEHRVAEVLGVTAVDNRLVAGGP